MSLYNDELDGGIGVARQSRADEVALTCTTEAARKAIVIAAIRTNLIASILQLVW